MTKKKKKKGKSKSGKRFGNFLRFVGKVLLVLFIISILIPLSYRWVNPPITPLMVMRKIQYGKPIEKEWRDMEEISGSMAACAIAAEDNNFLGHHGFDWGAIQKAVDEKKSGRRERGASTISQQTAKNVFLWPSHSWIRKGCEVYFTFLIELCWSKERIMEVYLNVIEMGNGIYGAQAAAQHYFHKNADRLTLQQAALITACYPNPLERNPAHPSGYISGRAAKIAALTHKIGKISFDKESVKKAQQRYKTRETKRRAKAGGDLLNFD